MFWEGGRLWKVVACGGSTVQVVYIKRYVEASCEL